MDRGEDSLTWAGKCDDLAQEITLIVKSAQALIRVGLEMQQHQTFGFERKGAFTKLCKTLRNLLVEDLALKEQLGLLTQLSPFLAAKKSGGT